MRSRSPHSPLHNPSFDLNSVFFAMNLFLGQINLPRIRTGKACAQRCVAKEDGRTAYVLSFSAFGVEGHESKDNRSEGRDVFGGAVGGSRVVGGRGAGAGRRGQGAGSRRRGQGGGVRGAGAGIAQTRIRAIFVSTCATHDLGRTESWKVTLRGPAASLNTRTDRFR